MRGAVEFDTEEMTVWTTSQNPHPIRLLLSAFTLGIPENKLRVISPDVGGGFGSKIFHYPEEDHRALGGAQNKPPGQVGQHAQRGQRDRQPGARPCDQRQAGCDERRQDHRPCMSRPMPITAPTSARLPRSFPPRFTLPALGLLQIPVIYGVTSRTMTNTVPVDAYRGAGRPEAAYMVERIVDLAARASWAWIVVASGARTLCRPTSSPTKPPWRCNTTAAITTGCLMKPCA